MADGILTPAMRHDHDIDFARWLHPAMWHVALESWQWIHQVAGTTSYRSSVDIGFWLSSATMVSTDRFRTDQGHCRRKWRLTDTDLCPCGETNDVPHYRILSPDKTEWRLISATLCKWRCCFVADQLWFMTCIREKNNRHHSFKVLSFWENRIFAFWH